MINKLKADIFGDMCTMSLLHEAYTTPKPGLVDKNNNGSHTDMDVPLFEKSALCLRSFFVDMFRIGETANNCAEDEYYQKLRAKGIEAENTMFMVTNNVNTHKGQIYSIGILAAAMGELTSSANKVRLSEWMANASRIAQRFMEDDFAALSDNSTYGTEQYRQYGLKGIRGEAASGFKSVLQFSLPELIRRMNEGDDLETAGTYALMNLISNVEDSCMIHRGGLKRAEEVRRQVSDAIKNGTIDREYMQKLDKEFIRDNLSPGGCADLLSITYLFIFAYNMGFLIDIFA